MKNEKMLHAIGGIDDDIIEDAVIQPSQKKQPFVRTPAFRRAVAIASCFVLIIGLALSMPTWFKLNNEGPDVPIEPGVSVNPGTLLPPNVQENESGLQISGLDQLSYYAAIRMIEGTPKPAEQSITGGSYRITLLTSGYDTDKREDQSMPNTTAPEGTQEPPVIPIPPSPPVDDEDIYYYALDPSEPFYINKVSMFQVELTDENGFLAAKLGLGLVDVVIIENCIWGENMITFRNGENFFSCLSDGGGVRQLGFSTHKYVEGFFIVKNIEQENYGFYIDMDAEGQVLAFTCGERENGGNRVDQNVKVVSSTVISNESRSFTVAELEEYFNSGNLPDTPRPPAQTTTSLEFWIAENVDNVDFSKFQEKYGLFGGREYFGTSYVPTIDENGQQVDPEHCVIYTVTSYPDYSDKEQHITGIYITDPNVEFYGITLGCTFEEFTELILLQGFAIIESNKNVVSARHGKVWITFTTEWIRIGVEVTNDQGIIF